MKKIWMLLPAVLLTAAGCNQNKAAGNSAKASSNASAAAPAPASGGESAGPERAPELVGRWTGVNDCEQWVEFHEDGTMTNSEGKSGTWRTRMQNGQLALGMETGGQSGGEVIENLTEDSFSMTDGKGSTRASMTRCS